MSSENVDAKTGGRVANAGGGWKEPGGLSLTLFSSGFLMERMNLAGVFYQVIADVSFLGIEELKTKNEKLKMEFASCGQGY